VLPSVDGLEQIRAALLELRAAGIASSVPPGSAPLGLLAASVVYKVSI
jgi:hypothetical protein